MLRAKHSIVFEEIEVRDIVRGEQQQRATKVEPLGSHHRRAQGIEFPFEPVMPRFGAADKRDLGAGERVVAGARLAPRYDHFKWPAAGNAFSDP